MQMNGTLDTYSVKTSEPPQTKTKELDVSGDHHEEEKDEEMKKGKWHYFIAYILGPPY